MDVKKLHTQQLQLKGSGGNMRCKLLQKRFTRKKRTVPNICAILPLKKIFYQMHFSNTLKYIKLVIPKILFILVLYSFNFYFKIA